MSRQQAETDRIRELGVALEEARLVAYDITQRQLGWTPAPGSPLSNERSDATATPLGKTWGAGVEHPEEMVKLWFELGSQHLYTSGIQMQHDPMLMTAPWPSVRAAVEHFATLAWVTAATDSSGTPVDAERRVARAALVELEDQRQLKIELATAKAAGPPSNNEDPTAVANYEKYRDGLAAMFPTFDKSSKTIDGMSLPNLSDRLGNFAEDHLQGGNGWNAYNLLSQNTHPTRTALLALRQPANGGYQMKAPLDHFEGVARIGLVSQYAALEELFRWYGWPRKADSIGSLARTINAALPDAVVEVV